jgi:hypothetical protein
VSCKSVLGTQENVLYKCWAQWQRQLRSTQCKMAKCCQEQEIRRLWEWKGSYSLCCGKQAGASQSRGYLSGVLMRKEEFVWGQDQGRAFPMARAMWTWWGKNRHIYWWERVRQERS